MANYKTGAQRYNDRMDKIFTKSEALGHTGLHSGKEPKAKSKALENKKKNIKPSSRKHIESVSKNIHNY